MGQVSPASTPREGRVGISMGRALFLAACYLLLVPQEMLGKAVEALRKGSPTADDWLSLAWHSLVESISQAKTASSQ